MSTTVLVGLIRFSVEIFPAVSGALCADAKRADLLQPFAPASASVISASRLSPGTNGRTHLSNLRSDIGHIVWQLSQVYRLPLSNAVHESHRCVLRLRLSILQLPVPVKVQISGFRPDRQEFANRAFQGAVP